MRLDDVQELAALMSRLSVNELEYVSPQGASVRLSRGLSAGAALPAATPASVPASMPAMVPGAAVAVPAGMGGIFHRRPAPGEPPFVSPGDVVQEGQTLGLMEAMKMLLPVEAPAAGVIAGIHVEDGQAVQPTTLLMDIVPEERG
ncbi:MULTISPECIES: acetyl-CoA carboxylase biotin carboxyl carrier protein [Achromobacter]|mgnify:CR=1 FL=1|uniref:Biotin carboxyl carrier protein of acetyl-CoA carboxylase n=1 Tax=Achromobacter denitrificans TaxID=32002 RepID=A0A6N0JGG9_ACHDE|nr:MULTISPECIES: biotin/lipoyl-containing protein [Achromobacter]MPT38210.1 acetyl-CoA carboxylase biotin carboxyl carrier protein [Achromobacter sp.]QKQ46184.1 acetyl-CoA carboxylase biotin carboxyl carrier protein [Achromobacter denitrificans]